ncbi:type II toxin-antitoxin system RelE/ParE family toxin [Paucibacter sp. R3-3]|uniref:Type II toxin-antitoxin system RelE/ParE family toxin n=1 Tax=Roseateles agri TaxID=3098619 RepID=A0ABU5DIQ8_9BURK|nr:type II toxin-antitoxin system RelE/ParE family toxin [Paucibacter sp. R3-3]MDY0746034.1 type II toxin-antitoxin system RelE/ParE family toxin [Paucibacter sp. R3-3]
MSYEVRLLPEAMEDLARLHDYLLERELARDGDLDYADEAVNAIQAGLSMLGRTPFSCRKCAGSAFLRELVIPFGRTGYVALFEIVSSTLVLVSAIRHQREDDYH